MVSFRGGRAPISRVLGALASVAVVGLVAAGCGSSSNAPKIALLLPETKTARYESHDKPDFEKKVKALCSNCQIIYSNANQAPATQQSQADAALTQGAKVLVLDPVDAASAVSIVNKANQRKVPVVSYDRLISNAKIAAYISFDNVRVGQLQAETLTQKLKAAGAAAPTIVMINGSPTDHNASLFKQGATGVFQKNGVKVGKEYDTPDWSPDKAQTEMQQAITALGKTGFNAAYAANDGTAGGAIAAMTSAGITPASKPTTGQDAELAAIQRILAGTQFMTVYKAVTPEAQDAATIAVALAKGQPLPSSLVNQHVDNGSGSVPSVILTPVAVTKSNVKDTIVKDGFWPPAQICTSAYASACKAAGIQ
ncbi:MAG: sugar ABC transporter substrate-binding protein [Thermoleophilaceae bacterium]